MKDHQSKTFEQIDAFFESIQKRVEQRQEQLKTDYKQIEGREKRRLKNRQIKLQREASDLQAYVQEFDYYI